MPAMESAVSTLQLLADIRDGKLDAAEAGIVPAIAADGGGMSSVTVAGGLYVLYQEGLLQAAPILVGCSGGSLAMAGTCNGQYKETYEIFTKALPEAGFINYWRMAKRQPMINLELLRNILKEQLDITSIVNNTSEFGFGVTKLVDKLEPVAISSREVKPEDLLEWLMRGIHMPRVAGKPPVDENGTAWADGGLSWHTTSDIAFRLNATHVLNLSNIPWKRWPYDGAQTDFVGRWLKRYGSPTNLDSYRAFARDQIVKINGPASPNVEVLYPDQKSDLPGTFEMNPEKLRKGYIAGQNAVRAALQLELLEEAPRPEPTHNRLLQARDQAVRLLGTGALQTVFRFAP